MNKSIIGKYNIIIDEIGHIFISVITIFILNIIFSFTFGQILVLFIASIFIDLDHLFNPIIGRIFGLKATIIPSKLQNGVTIKILHGIDIFLVFSIIIIYVYGDFGFAIGMFVVLTFHELWDYLVYDHTSKELFLITRAMAKFNPGQRKSMLNIVFDQDSLPR
jgi:hypothetical protein